MPTTPEWADAISLTDIVTTIIWVGALIAFVFKGMPWLRRVGRIVDVVAGTPSIGEIPGQPGMIARLTTVEDLARDAAYHSKPNGGGSFADNINRRFDTIDEKVDRLAGQVAKHDKDLSFLSPTEKE